MTPDALLWIAAAGFVCAGIAATAAKVLHDFSGHELEEYCIRRKRLVLFDEILDRHERVALGAEALQIVGTSVLVVAGVMWILIVGRDTASLSLGSFVAAVAVSALLLLLVTSWVPWAIASLWSAPFLYHTWRIWVVVSWIVWPLSVGVNVVDALMRRMAGRHQEEEDEEEAFEDEILTMVTAGERDGLLESDAREMIEGVIELGDTDVADIMTPRSDMDALEVDLSWPEILQFVIECGRTRIPVYEKSLDNIVGVLFVKDLLPELSKNGDKPKRSLRAIIRKPWFVPRTKRVDAMLQDFLRTRSHLAIVMDEYQSVTGVVTIEDVLEEIVGEIVDESDKDEEDGIDLIDESTAEVQGRVHIDDVNDRMGLDLPESDDYDTIAGLIVEHFGRIPKVGQSLEQDGVLITVLEATRRRVERVRIETQQRAASPSKELTAQ